MDRPDGSGKIPISFLCSSCDSRRRKDDAGADSLGPASLVSASVRSVKLGPSRANSEGGLDSSSVPLSAQWMGGSLGPCASGNR
jgi:hypothetical protein